MWLSQLLKPGAIVKRKFYEVGAADASVQCSVVVTAGPWRVKALRLSIATGPNGTEYYLFNVGLGDYLVFNIYTMDDMEVTLGQAVVVPDFGLKALCYKKEDEVSNLAKFAMDHMIPSMTSAVLSKLCMELKVPGYKSSMTDNAKITLLLKCYGYDEDFIGKCLKQTKRKRQEGPADAEQKEEQELAQLAGIDADSVLAEVDDDGEEGEEEQQMQPEEEAAAEAHEGNQRHVDERKDWVMM